MNTVALADLSALDLHAGYRDGAFTPVQVTRAALDRIEALNPAVNAVVHLDADAALAMAEESAQRWSGGRPLGPADGIPATVKDIMLTAGWPTRRGSRLTEGEAVAAEDAPVVARLREGGAVLLGKNATPEFAWKGVTDSPLHGATSNPWGADLTAGGSSGGGASAVGLGMGAWTVGTDGGGSVRIPAAFTGTVAFKPTYGLIPLYPPSPYGTLAHAGPMARSVADTAVLLDVVSRPDHRDWSALPAPTSSFTDGLHDGVAGLRIALSLRLGYGTNDAQVEASVRQAAQVFADAGATVVEVDPPIADPVEAFHVLWFTGAAKVVEQYGPDAIERLDPLLRWAIETYGRVDASTYLDATITRMSLGVQMGAFHADYDLLLTPTMPIAAFAAGQDVPDGWHSQMWTSFSPYTYPFNLTQQPALSVPCGFTSDDRPIGLQIVGARHDDARVLRAGQVFEQRTTWHQARPPLLEGLLR